ncbi:MAG: cytochrome-c peroxidase, partial [Bacteroidota bacterium]
GDLVGSGLYGSLPDNSAHLGRGGFTGEEADYYKFKVPQLYNLKDSPFYGHGGTFTSIKEVIEYKNSGIPAKVEVVNSPQLAENFGPIGLTDAEVDQLTAFIESALHDPNLHRYVPRQTMSGMCFPNADSLSRDDLGCL